MHKTRNLPLAFRDSRLPSQLVILLLLLVTTWLYAPALDFGFMWDDPICPLLGGIVGRSVEELVRPSSDFHFYRPGTQLYHLLFLTSDDTFAVPLLHAAQIGYHLLNIALVYTLVRRLGLGNWVAAAVGGLVALYPFSHQAVAWAAPQQSLVMALQNGVWLTYIESRRRRANRNLIVGLSLLLFLIALTIQESTVALSGIPLFIEWVLRRDTDRAYSRLALVYPLIAGGFALLWLWLPRQTGYATLAFESSVILYLLQGFVFPLLGRPTGYDMGQTTAPTTLLVVIILALGGLVLTAWRTGRGRHALLGLAWALMGIAPSVVGLRYSVVSLGSRLLYCSSPGVALLWACALLPPTGGSLTRRLWRASGAVLLVLIALQSSLILNQFQQMYAVGAAHMNELIQVAPTKDTHLLFVNFPDRYALKRPPYPLGYWGVTLAPVSVDLGAFPAVITGRHPHTISRSIPVVDFDPRNAGPYLVDMRGEITPPDQLYQLAHQMDAVYLSRYFPDGSFALQWAGDVATVPPAPSCELANFGQTLCLQQTQIDRSPDELILALTWLSLSTAQPHDAIFAHVGTPDQPPIAQNDDDAWLGILPLTVWQPGDVIHEQRIIPLPKDTPLSQHQVRIGVYNRVTGQRLPATMPQGDPFLDDVVIIGDLSAPN